MVRIFENAAKYLGLLLAAARVERVNIADVYSRANQLGVDDLTLRALREVDGDGTGFEMDEVQRDLLDALEASRGSFSDGEIIDELARMVSGPYARSRFSRDTLRAFRRALMDPRAITALKKRELSCPKCSLPMAVGSMATIVDEGGEAGLSVWCSRCSLPQSIRCSAPECDHHVTTPQRVTQIMRAKEYLCSKHQEEKARKLAATDDPTAIPRGVGNPSVAGEWDGLGVQLDDDEGPGLSARLFSTDRLVRDAAPPRARFTIPPARRNR